MSIHNITQGTTAEIRQATDSRDRQRCGSSGSHININSTTSTALVKLSVPDGHQKDLGAVERGNYKSNGANLARSENGDDYRLDVTSTYSIPQPISAEIRQHADCP
jgi:hypothetical protein